MIVTALDNIACRPAPNCLAGTCSTPARRTAGSRSALTASRDFCNPAGFVQGGILSAMLDDTMGPAVFAMTEGRLYTTTITMTVNFLAPASRGRSSARRP